MSLQTRSRSMTFFSGEYIFCMVMNLTLIFSSSTKSGVGAKTPSSCGFLCRTSCRFSLSCFHEPSAVWKSFSMASTWPLRGFKMHLCMAFSNTTSVKENAATVTTVWRENCNGYYLGIHVCGSIQPSEERVFMWSEYLTPNRLQTEPPGLTGQEKCPFPDQTFCAHNK